MFKKLYNYILKKNQQITLVILCLMLISIMFFVIGLLLALHLQNYDQTLRENIITIYAACVGGFLALFGVLLTIVAGKGAEKERRRLNYIPEFFLPNKYDLAKATYYTINSNNEANIIIPNYRVYIKNTDKTDFIISEVNLDSKNNNTSKVNTCNYYIDRGRLFCLSFYSKETVNRITIKAKSIDKQEYFYEIDLESKIACRK